MKLGISIESTGLPFREALPAIAKLGGIGVQFQALAALHPQQLGQTARREIRTMLRSYSLELFSIETPLRYGLDVFENQQKRLEYISEVMGFAFDLGCQTVVVPFPKIPNENEPTKQNTLKESMEHLGRLGDRIGVNLAFDIGLDPATNVVEYLQKYKTPCLRVNYDPANFLIHQHEPTSQIFPLKDCLQHVHARDIRSANASQGPKEVAVGAGDLPWLAIIGTLSACEYRGPIVLRRQDGNRIADLAVGIKTLKQIMI
ncbi:MAG: sugar phosphate isomerase/epimerase [Gemmataceae bacterium]|jgi:sugar phosphate isomerase/epimerase|nr:sugar phosphate isomerase/epimerase [Gemmataceae bacterium]